MARGRHEALRETKQIPRKSPRKDSKSTDVGKINENKTHEDETGKEILASWRKFSRTRQDGRIH